ncbi:MAG: phosphoglycerate mutase family protein [Patescibacteria group bacterium]
MALPNNLLVGRHGQSEGNLANRAVERGDLGIFTEDFMRRHSSQYRLTDIGVGQAQRAGAWLRANLPAGRRRYSVSDTVRACETAGHFGIPGARWERSISLRERDRGKFDMMLPADKVRDYPDDPQRQIIDGPYWTPPDGESFVNLCDRALAAALPLLDSGSVWEPDTHLAVCHGEEMWALRYLLEGLAMARCHEMMNSGREDDQIWNCQIHWYRQPVSAYRYKFVRRIRPTFDEAADTGWLEIPDSSSSSQELLDEAAKVPRIMAK